MSIDLGSMLNPGAVLTEGRISSSLLARRVDLDFALPVGAGLSPTGQTSTSIGVFGVTDTDGGPPLPGFSNQEMMGEAGDQLASLGSGTVATVSLYYTAPIPVDEAQEIADRPGADVRVTWAGFDTSLVQESSPEWTWVGVLGYGTCLNQNPLHEDLLSATSAGFSRGAMFEPASVQESLDSVISGLENIVGRPELVDYLVRPYGEDPESVSAVLEELRSDPEVRLLVVTGPSPEVAEFVEAAPAGASASVLAVDFYNWSETVCGGVSQ